MTPTETNLLILALVLVLLVFAALVERWQDRRDARRTKALADRQRRFWARYERGTLPWTEWKR